MQNPNASKTKVKIDKKIGLVLTYSCKCNKEIWQESINAQDCNKNPKMQKILGAVLKGAFAICKVTNNPINHENNTDILRKASII